MKKTEKETINKSLTREQRHCLEFLIRDANEQIWSQSIIILALIVVSSLFHILLLIVISGIASTFIFFAIVLPEYRFIKQVKKDIQKGYYSQTKEA